MCLTKSYVHENQYCRPFVAGEDIIVFKALDHYDLLNGKKTICTPYQYYPISFTEGKCVMNSYLECTTTKYVDIGIHSFRKEEKAEITCLGFSETKMTKHWAIIPKGSKYFIGDNDDIVSNKLIIFRTREDFRKYKREHECFKLKFA